MDTWDYKAPHETDVPDDYVWERLRNRRNALLAESDWRVLADAPGDQSSWLSYRQALRDLPSNTVDPREAIWPGVPV